MGVGGRSSSVIRDSNGRGHVRELYWQVDFPVTDDYILFETPFQ